MLEDLGESCKLFSGFDYFLTGSCNGNSYRLIKKVKRKDIYYIDR